MYFEIHKNSTAGQPYWWVIKSNGNHAVLAQSEMYTNKAACLHAIQLVITGASESKYFDKTGEN